MATSKKSRMPEKVSRPSRNFFRKQPRMVNSVLPANSLAAMRAVSFSFSLPAGVFGLDPFLYRGPFSLDGFGPLVVSPLSLFKRRLRFRDPLIALGACSTVA
jgi:hypothetical protein